MKIPEGIQVIGVTTTVGEVSKSLFLKRPQTALEALAKYLSDAILFLRIGGI